MEIFRSVRQGIKLLPISVKDSYLVFAVNDESITVPVPIDDGEEHTAYIEKLGQTIRLKHLAYSNVASCTTERQTLFSMKVDNIRAAGAGGKLDTDALKQSDLYLGNNKSTCSGYQMR